MTIDEFKAELSELAAKIDEPLAEQIREECMNVRLGSAIGITVDRLFPADMSAHPETGVRLRLSTTCWFELVRFQYDDAAPLV